MESPDKKPSPALDQKTSDKKFPVKKFLIGILIISVITIVVVIVVWTWMNKSKSSDDTTSDKETTSSGQTTSDKVVISEAEFLANSPNYPKAIGNPLKVSGSAFEVSSASDKYVYFKDFQLPYIWATIKNLGSQEEKYDVRLTSGVPEGWESVDEMVAHTWIKPGEEDSVKLMYKPIHISMIEEPIESTFTYQVTSSETNEALDFTITIVVYPQFSSDKEASGDSSRVEGVVKDAKTGASIKDAEVTLWLGQDLRIMPHDMVKITQSDGRFEISCYPISALNKHYDPYLTFKGYRLVIQKEGYQTYVHQEYLKSGESGPIVLAVNLTPLDPQEDYKLVWEKELDAPGVWEIAPTDKWDKFAVAMGKHPDFDDAELLPSSSRLIDNQGNILWSKALLDESWAIDIASDGSYIACASEAGDQYHYVWDADGNEVWKKRPENASLEMVFSPDNQSLATGPSASGDGFVLYNTKTGDEKWSFDTGGRGARSITFTQDGKYVLAAPILHLFNSSGKLIWRRYIAYVPYIIEVDSENSQIMVADKGDVVSMFDFDGNLLWRKDHFLITYAAMSEDGSTTAVLTSYGEIFVYNAKGELQWYRLVPGTSTEMCTYCHGAGHNGVDITPDGKHIVVGSGTYNTVLYDSKGNIVWRHGDDATIDPAEHPLKHSVMSVKISSDGTKIVSGYGTSNPKLVYFEKSQ